MRSNVQERTRVLLVNAPCSLLRNWREQWPSNQDDLEQCHGGSRADFISIPHNSLRSVRHNEKLN